MSLVDELVAAAGRDPGNWIAKVVRRRHGLAWDALLGHVRDMNREASRWADDGGREPVAQTHAP